MINYVETVLNYDNITGNYGILCAPKDNLHISHVFVLLNSGLIHNVGPNNIYTKLSRELAEVGIATLRFDLPEIGDNILSHKSKSAAEIFIDEIRKVIEHLNYNYEFESFVLSGICTGANNALQYALIDKRIVGVCSINGEHYPKDLMYKNRFKMKREIKLRYYKKNLFSIKRWIKLLSGKSQLISGISVKSLLYSIYKRISSSQKPKDNVKKEQSNSSNELVELLDKKINCLQIYSEGSESLYYSKVFDDYSIIKNYENYTQHVILNSDHIFSSIESQNKLIEIIKTWFVNVFGN